MNFDQYYLSLVDAVKQKSKDRKVKVGAVIVKDGVVVATGYNGFPRGALDDVDERHIKPLKLEWTEHAERNAIFAAARNGVALLEATLYCDWFPCTDCARAIIQSGITELRCNEPNWEEGSWAEKHCIAREMFEECGIRVVFLDQYKRG